MRLDRLDVGRDVWRGVYDLSEWDEESEESGFLCDGRQSLSKVEVSDFGYRFLNGRELLFKAIGTIRVFRMWMPGVIVLM